jgi:hypothetical protein
VILMASVGLACGSRTGLDDAFLERSDAAPSTESTDCPDPARSIFVLTQAPSSDAHGQLLRFDPQASAFSSPVTVPCLPPIELSTALTVDRQGNTYVAGISIDREVVRVDGITGACQELGVAASVSGFGMAFTGGAARGRDALYVVDGPELDVVDSSTFRRAAVAPFDSAGATDGAAPERYWPSPGSSNITVYLTGTAQGDVFALGSSKPLVTPAFTSIGQVDKSSGAVTDQWSVGVPDIWPIYNGRNLRGFAFWGGDFYFFVVSGPGTVVWRFHPSDGSTQQVAQTDSVVLAAGVSTCAPTGL